MPEIRYRNVSRELSRTDRIKIGVFVVFWLATAVTLWADNQLGWNVFPDRSGHRIAYSVEPLGGTPCIQHIHPLD